MEYLARWINIWKNKRNNILTGQWVEGLVTYTPEYMEWYRQNTILFLSVTQQLNDPRTTITHNVVGTIFEETHLQVPRAQSMFCTPSPIH